MASVEYSAVLNGSAQQTWQVLRQFGGIATWHPAIARSEMEDGRSERAVGAIRRLVLTDGAVLRERLLSMDETDMSLSYQFEESPLPLDNYRAQVRVLGADDGSRCVVEWKATFDVREAGTTAHFEGVINELIIGGHNSLAAFLQK
ncbi:MULTISPECIES: SRPBCC family protein [Pseudomonas]|uniref:Polyketide cyclase n=1 Tax=Pseudomonas fulva TaxID=47880 RepID=A0A0D0KNX8_9PSED|nr:MULTISPECIES: SRPBCC family protein [Pseudomonas]KIP98638.1 polyketide cyclase [Pseudomonas fulva]